MGSPIECRGVVILSGDEPKRFFVDTNVVGYVASLIEPLAHDYLDLIRGDVSASLVSSMATVVAANWSAVQRSWSPPAVVG